jgi:hypothetical protein
MQVVSLPALSEDAISLPSRPSKGQHAPPKPNIPASVHSKLLRLLPDGPPCANLGALGLDVEPGAAAANCQRALCWQHTVPHGAASWILNPSYCVCLGLINMYNSYRRKFPSLGAPKAASLNLTRKQSPPAIAMPAVPVGIGAWRADMHGKAIKLRSQVGQRAGRVTSELRQAVARFLLLGLPAF